MAARRSPSEFSIHYGGEELDYSTLKKIGFDELAERRDDEISQGKQAGIQCALLFAASVVLGCTGVYKYFTQNKNDMNAILWEKLAPAVALIGGALAVKRSFVGHDALEDSRLLDKACKILRPDEPVERWEDTVFDLEQAGFLRPGSYQAHRHQP